MKKIYLLIVILFVANQLSFGKCWIVFYAEHGQPGRSTSESTSKGNVFVSLIQEFGKDTLVNSWGLNPENSSDGIGFINEIHSSIKYDLAKQRRAGFMIDVTLAELEYCERTKNHWVNNRYAATLRNCVDFLKDIVTTLNESRQAGSPKIKPPIGLYLNPTDYVKALKSLNLSLEAKFSKGPDVPFKQNVSQRNISELSEGAKLLFRNTKSNLSSTEKNFIYNSLGFKLTKDKKRFKSDENEEYAFEAETIPTDMNKDGNEEIFIAYGNTYTSGNTGSEIVLFVKNKSGTFEKNLGFPGMMPQALLTSNLGYSDLVIGGPGFTFPIWRWNGAKYALSRRISDRDLRTTKTIDIQTISHGYTGTIK